MTDVTPCPNRLFVAWRRPDGPIMPVGQVDRVAGPGGVRYTFGYLNGAATQDDFAPLLEFPDLHRVYSSDRLFPFLENRIVPQARADWPTYAVAMGLSRQSDPFFVLAQTGGHRVTDTFEVFAPPFVDPATGASHIKFFVRGIRHIDGARERVTRLSPGDVLQIVPDHDNQTNHRALLLSPAGTAEVGWVPDLLLDTVDRLRDACGADPLVRVVRVNGPDVPERSLLVAEMDGCPGVALDSFAGTQFDPLVSLATA